VVDTNIANSEAKNFTLKPSNTITRAGGWVAMDATSSKVTMVHSESQSTQLQVALLQWAMGFRSLVHRAAQAQYMPWMLQRGKSCGLL